MNERREWTARRIANAKRAVQRDHDSVPLFPDMVKHKTVDDRIMEIEKDDFDYKLRMRAYQAAKWREARKAYFALPPRTRQGMKKFWDKSPVPAEAHYLMSVIREHLQTGFSPWSWLRYNHQLRLVGAGKLERKHLNTTFNQHQYGQYPWMKLGSGKHKKKLCSPTTN